MEFMRNALRELSAIVRADTPTHLHLRSRLAAIVVISIGIDLIATVAIYYAERNGPQTEIRSFGDALFFTTTQLLTVSSQMRNPVTTWGRIVDVFLEAYGISIVATLAGSFGAFFHRRSQERRAEQADLG
ncbi:MAG TPA: ion channel [Streptosporangiaceae bacterium]|jgi:hypothetical protein